MLFTSRVLPTTSAAIFIIFSVARVSASSCSTIQRPPICDCSNTTDGYELRCSAFTVQVKPKAVVHIQCDNNVVSDFSVLSGLLIGEVDSLIIRLCPLPTVSLNQLMQNMNVSKVKNVQLTYTGVNGNSAMIVRRDLFRGLSNVTSLSLHTNGTTQLMNEVFTDMHNLVFIDLQSNNFVLTKDTFCGLTKLQVLQLCSYNKTFLEPGVFHNLIHLRTLVLSGNMDNLSRSVFSDVKNLVSLDVNSNKINSLPSDLFVDLTKLRNINLDANEFIILPQTLFMNNSEMETVKIQDNRGTLKTLPPRMLADLTTLKMVRITNCDMSTLPEDLLWGSVSIHTISLNNNAFITSPETLFRYCRKLQSLDISYNRITYLPNHVFSSVLNLKYLKINNNQLPVITNQLFLPLRNLMVLDLKDNRLTHVETKAFEMLSALISVNMSDNMLTFDETVLSPLNYCGMLENIELENNTLNKMFSDWLNLENLETLNLAYNKISQIKSADLQFISSKDISVNVSYNNISEIDIFHDWRNLTSQFSKYHDVVNIEPWRTVWQLPVQDLPIRHIFIEGNFIKCDCKVHETAIYEIVLEENPESLQCTKRVEYRDFVLEFLQPKYLVCFVEKAYGLDCPEECTCQLMSSNETLLVYCNESNLTSMTTREETEHNLSRGVFAGTHNLRILEIDSVKMRSLPSNVLIDLTELRYVHFYRNEFLSLPQNLFINNRKLAGLTIINNRRTLSTLPPALLGNLTNLYAVTLRSCNTSTLPEDLLWGSENIFYIRLTRNAFTTLPKLLFKDCLSLRLLDISYNRITDLPTGLFSEMKHLNTLKINNNQLSIIRNNCFSSLWYLKVLDLKDNKLRHIESKVFIQFQWLHSLNMSNNLLTFRDTTPVSPLKFCDMLEDLQLANNSVTKIPIDWRHLKKLESLNLAHNKIFQIKAEDLHFTSAKNTFVNIRYNNISELDIFENKRIYKYVSESAVYNVPVRHFSVEGNPTNCHCKVYTFLKYNEQEITAQIKITTETNTSNSQCVKFEAYTGQELQKVPIKYITCLFKKTERRLNCPEACSCRLFPTTKTMVVDCHQTNLLSTAARESVMHNLSRDIFSKAHNLESLEIKWNRMIGLTPNLFLDLINLRKVSIYANKFESLPQNLFVNNIDLETIIIESNVVTLKTLPSRFLASLTKLREVKLDSCNISYLPEDLLWGSTSINTISLKNNALNTLPEQLFYDCSELQTLDISFNRITDLPKELFHNTRNLKTLKINNNKLSILRGYLHLNKLETLDLKYNRLIGLEERTFETTAFWEFESKMPSLKIVDVSNNILTSDVIRRWSFFDSYPNLENIQLANNYLTEFCSHFSLLDNLQTLNVAHNKISQLSIKFMDKFKCKNGIEILKLLPRELCPAEPPIAVFVSYAVAALGLLIGFLLAVYYKLQNAIKIWLYAHRCCLWFVNEDELDRGKLYDAFVSYAYQDEAFVLDELVPRLEADQYTLCLHQRDWIPGEFIPEQIARSVEDSRRTIIVLSSAFLESTWSRMEFCAAHKQSLSEGRVRLIMIMYGDIGPTDNLEPELRSYITMNTYVKWGDHWFWEKLRYAMPHNLKYRNEIQLQPRA